MVGLSNVWRSAAVQSLACANVVVDVNYRSGNQDGSLRFAMAGQEATWGHACDEVVYQHHYPYHSQAEIQRFQCLHE